MSAARGAVAGPTATPLSVAASSGGGVAAAAAAPPPPAPTGSDTPPPAPLTAATAAVVAVWVTTSALGMFLVAPVGMAAKWATDAAVTALLSGLVDWHPPPTAAARTVAETVRISAEGMAMVAGFAARAGLGALALAGPAVGAVAWASAGWVPPPPAAPPAGGALHGALVGEGGWDGAAAGVSDAAPRRRWLLAVAVVYTGCLGGLVSAWSIHGLYGYDIWLGVAAAAVQAALLAQLLSTVTLPASALPPTLGGMGASGGAGRWSIRRALAPPLPDGAALHWPTVRRGGRATGFWMAAGCIGSFLVEAIVAVPLLVALTALPKRTPPVVVAAVGLVVGGAGVGTVVVIVIHLMAHGRQTRRDMEAGRGAPRGSQPLAQAPQLGGTTFA